MSKQNDLIFSFARSKPLICVSGKKSRPCTFTNQLLVCVFCVTSVKIGDKRLGVIKEHLYAH